MARKSIAVVIPTFNRSKILTKALDSVKAQTRLPDQVIVVDDGSTDNTETACRQWMKQYSFHVDYIKTSNHGLSHTRNVGIKHTHCELIATLDDDDLFEPDHLQLLELPFVAQSDLPLAFGLSNLDHSSLIKIIEGLPKLKIKSDVYILRDARAIVSALCPMNASQVMFSKFHAQRVGYFNESLRSVEDWDFFYRILSTQEQQSGFVNHYITMRAIGNDNLTLNSHQMERSYVKVCIGLLKDKEKLFICPDEINKLQTVLNQSVHEYRYTSSSKGLMTYIKTIPELLEYSKSTTIGSGFSLCFDSRSLLRALRATFRNFKLYPQAKDN